MLLRMLTPHRGSQLEWSGPRAWVSPSLAALESPVMRPLTLQNLLINHHSRPSSLWHNWFLKQSHRICMGWTRFCSSRFSWFLLFQQDIPRSAYKIMWNCGKAQHIVGPLGFWMKPPWHLYQRHQKSFLHSKWEESCPSEDLQQFCVQSCAVTIETRAFSPPPIPLQVLWPAHPFVSVVT